MDINGGNKVENKKLAKLVLPITSDLDKTPLTVIIVKCSQGKAGLLAHILHSYAFSHKISLFFNRFRSGFLEPCCIQ